MAQISTDGKWKDEQGTHDLAAHVTHGETDENGAPCQEEPCLGIIPHPLNMLSVWDDDKMNKQGN